MRFGLWFSLVYEEMMYRDGYLNFDFYKRDVFNKVGSGGRV